MPDLKHQHDLVYEGLQLLKTEELAYVLTRELDVETTHVSVQLSLENIPSEDLDKSGVLYYRLQDAEGQEIRLIEKVGVSPVYGPFRYVHQRQGQSHYTINVPIPEGTSVFEAGVVSLRQRLRGNVSLDATERGPNTDTDFSAVTPKSPIPVDGVRLTFPVQPGAEYELFAPVQAIDQGKALLLLSFMDSAKNLLLPAEGLSYHPEFGAYQYAQGTAGAATSVKIPECCTELVLRGKQFSGSVVELIGAPLLENKSDQMVPAGQLITSWIENLDPADDIILLQSTAGPISLANKLLLRSNRTAMELAQHGWKVVYSPFSTPDLADRLINENLLQLAPDELPGVVDRLVAKGLTGRRVLYCSSFADMRALSVQNRLQDYGWKSVYEIRDDMEEFRRVGYSKWYSPALEQRYSQEAEGILATSPRLRDKISVISGRQDVAYLPNAAPDELIEQTRTMRSVQHYDQHRSTAVVGYLGHLTDSWFDWQKFISVAKLNPDLDFEIIGHGMPKDIRLPLNVRYLGAMSHDECLPIVSRWTVGLIPFVESRLTYGVDPNKVYEYVAMGLRTVSAPMGDLENVPGVSIYRTTEEFSHLLRDAVNDLPDEEFYNSCSEFLEEAAWSFRVGEIRGFIEGLYK